MCESGICTQGVELLILKEWNRDIIAHDEANFDLRRWRGTFLMSMGDQLGPKGQV